MGGYAAFERQLIKHTFLSPHSDLEVSLVQWQEKAGWDLPALYLDIREETPVWP